MCDENVMLLECVRIDLNNLKTMISVTKNASFSCGRERITKRETEKQLWKTMENILINLYYIYISIFLLK